MSLDNYNKSKVIGKGSYGEVWLSKHKTDKKQVHSTDILLFVMRPFVDSLTVTSSVLIHNYRQFYVNGSSLK